jgi:hypothetical protein
LYEINEEIPSAGITAEVFLETEASTGVVLTITEMNGLKQGKTFKKYFAEALVYLTSQKNQDSFTQYFLGIDLYDDAYTVTGVVFSADTGCATPLVADGLPQGADQVYDNDDFSINNSGSAVTIRCIKYYVNNVDNGAG